jgi:hypothetical protein
VVYRDRRPRPERRDEALPGRVRGVGEALADQPAQWGVVEGGVEVAGDDADLAVRRGRRDLAEVVPPSRGVRAERRGWVRGRQAYGCGARHLEVRAHHGERRGSPIGQLRQRVSGVEAAALGAAARIDHAVRQQPLQTGLVEPVGGRRGELLHAEDVRAGAADQVDQARVTGLPELQVGGEDPQSRAGRVRPASAEGAGQHDAGEHRGDGRRDPEREPVAGERGDRERDDDTRRDVRNDGHRRDQHGGEVGHPVHADETCDRPEQPAGDEEPGDQRHAPPPGDRAYRRIVVLCGRHIRHPPRPQSPPLAPGVLLCTTNLSAGFKLRRIPGGISSPGSGGA